MTAGPFDSQKEADAEARRQGVAVRYGSVRSARGDQVGMAHAMHSGGPKRWTVPGIESVVEARDLRTAVFQALPRGNKSKIGGKRMVMLTGPVAKQMGKPNYTRINLDDMSEDELAKLAAFLGVTSAA